VLVRKNSLIPLTEWRQQNELLLKKRKLRESNSIPYPKGIDTLCNGYAMGIETREKDKG